MDEQQVTAEQQQADPGPAAPGPRSNGEVEKQRVTFVELGEDEETIQVTFHPFQEDRGFQLTLINANWTMFDLVEDIRKAAGTEEPSAALISQFFRQHVQGGPAAVPLKRTRTVFDAVSQYLEKVTAGDRNLEQPS